MLRLSRLLTAWQPPTRCWLCGDWPQAQAVCARCVAEHGRMQLRCRSCAQRLPTSAVSFCAACLRRPPPLDACWAAVDYAEPWRTWIAAWKFHHNPALAHAAAQQLLAQPLDVWQQPFDRVLPIPADPARLKQRGFDHTLLLARALQRHGVHLPLAAASLDAHSLQRLPSRQDAGQQAQRDRKARFSAMRQALVLQTQAAASVQGQRLLLVDDVMTTGATLYSAAQLLRRAGAASVSAVVFARTPR